MTHDIARTTRRPAALAAFLWSLTAVPLGLWQLTAAEDGPFTHPNQRAGITLPDAFPDALAPSLLIAAGLLGLLLARARPRLWPATAAYAAVFGLLVPTMMLLAMAGYLMAFLMPAALVVGPILLARGNAVKLAAAGVVIAAVAALAALGPLSPDTLGSLLGDLGGGLGDLGFYPLTEIWAAAGGLAWAGSTAELLRRRRAERPAPAWLAPDRAARWGKAAAYLAFACSLPYGLSRMSWLTPWSYLVSAEELDAHPGMRLWGLLLGFSCLAGGVLCLGLVRPWGERWPYWVPLLRGRPVPPKAAIVPAVIVAYLFTLAGISITFSGIQLDHPELIVVFPFLIWGPALAAAALAYAIRRRANT